MASGSWLPHCVTSFSDARFLYRFHLLTLLDYKSVRTLNVLIARNPAILADLVYWDCILNPYHKEGRLTLFWLWCDDGMY